MPSTPQFFPAPETERVVRERARRLFFALWPGEALRAALAARTHPMLAAGEGRAVPAGDFHVTLAFLGQVAEHRLAQALCLGAAVANEMGSRTSALAITFDHIEYWPRAQLVCAAAGPQSGGAAGQLAELLRTRLGAAGFAPDLKAFRAHVTLARKVRLPITERPFPPTAWQLSEFALVESRTSASGSLYSVLSTWLLGGQRVQKP